MTLNTIELLDAEIKSLEAQKRLVEKRDVEVTRALEVIQRYAGVLTLAQRKQLASLAGDAANGQQSSAADGVKGRAIGRKLGKVPPKYRLPTGETWTGRGLTPKVFVAWGSSTEGKAWRAANPATPFPGVGGTGVQASPDKPAINKAMPIAARRAAKTAVKAARKKTGKPVARSAAKRSSRA
ncbi:H-NS histone family protein [Stenotrophomonas indicatrix]|uniref:H-NS family nucleoid-associated regulatory protein n=1 Tax=Stenotrophomonas indicatrix TaxID=2045451 RepID=UPI0030096C06